MRLSKVVLLVASSLWLSACAAIETEHGYIPTEAEIGQLYVGVDSQSDVTRKIGSPVMSDIFEGRYWFYVATDFSTFGPLRSEISRREILSLEWDDFGTLAGISRFDLEDGRVVYPVQAYTPTHGRELTLAQQIFGNLSNVSTEQAADQ